MSFISKSATPPFEYKVLKKLKWNYAEISHLRYLKFVVTKPLEPQNKTKSIEGSGAGRNEAYFLSKLSGS